MLPTKRYPSRLAREHQHWSLRAGQQMGFFISLALMILCLGIVVGAATSRAAVLHGEICGVISTNDTWTADQNPYYVTCDAKLLPGFTLQIEPGVEIRFATGASLQISGTLHAIGVPGQLITFTSGLAEPAPGDWEGLRFVAGSSDSHLAWCVVEYATTGVHVYAMPGETVSPLFTDCAVRHHSLHGFEIEGFVRACDEGLAQPTIAGCLAEQNGECGIYGYGHADDSEFCTGPAAGRVGGTVSGSVIRQNQDSGICLEAELLELGHGDVSTTIEGNRISGNSEHGVHLLGDDPVHPRIQNNLIYGNAGAGIQSDAEHDEDEFVLVNNTLVGNGGAGVVFNQPAGQVLFYNNIVFENEGYGLVCNGTGVPQVSNNDLWDNASGNYDGCAPGISDIYADPLLIDPAGGDFRLTVGSPCIDTGTTVAAPATDFEGTVRPQGDGVDIGAYELWYQRIYLPVVLRQ